MTYNIIVRSIIVAGIMSLGTWQFELYVIGGNRRSALTVENLRGICSNHLKGRCHVDVFDIKEHPELAVKKQITATPVLIKKYPLPERTLVGDLSSAGKVLEGLDLGSGNKSSTGKGYRQGLEKQGLHLKQQHEQRQR